jgi:hypothetical protein
MANEVTVPLLPCRSIDDIARFYQALGFEVTYRQQRPNPYVGLRREDLNLHFFGLPDFKAEDSYGSCLVYVPDVGELYRSFARGMRAAHGKLLFAGIPRMTRPRKRKNTGDLSGFSVIDPGGNWIRIFQAPGQRDAAEPADDPTSRLARALQNAVVLGEAKGDHRQAARILDTALARPTDPDEVVDRVEAMVYRAELALVLRDAEQADALLAQVRGLGLTEGDRDRLADALDNARELELTRRADLEP